MPTTKSSNTVVNIKQVPLAFAQANTAFQSANNVAPQVQPAFNTANSAGLYANASFLKANAAFESANNVAPQVQPAFDKANSAGLYANASFSQANAAFTSANNVAPQIQPAFDKANAAFAAANSVNVYGANTAVNSFFAIPQGTTAERPASSQLGALRYNTTLGLVEVYTLNGWTTVTGSVPTISNVTPASYGGGSGQAFTIFGTGFQSDASVRFVTANASEYIAATVSYGNTTTLQATTPRAFTVADGPLDVKVIQANGTASVTKFDTIQTGTSPSWNTASGTLATIYEDATGSHATIEAYDPDTSVTYSIASGSLPSGLSLVSANGAIVGNAGATSTQTTSTFTAAATDAAGNQITRSFSIVVAPVATGGTVTTFTSGANTYRIHAFTSNSSFVAGKTLTADILVVGAGGAGGYGFGDQDCGKGGGGAGGVVWGQGRTITSGTYTVSIGQGGNARTNASNPSGNAPAGEKGNNTSAFSVTAEGGGAGGQSDNQNWNTNNTGGSGGGAGARNNNGTTGWPATQPSYPGWTSYGNPGGSTSNSNAGGGGGGGAGAAGSNASGPDNNSSGGAGGAGIDMSSYFGTTYGASGWFAGGGGGASYTTSTILSQSPGGQGGGGKGVSGKESTGSPSPQAFTTDINGSPNTGGGGGGASEDGQDSSGNQAGGGSASGGGGSGIVLVRYLIRP
jgi:hypothetical protein